MNEFTKHTVDRDDQVLLELKAVLKGFLGERVALILYIIPFFTTSGHCF